MSRENLELVQACFDAANRRDFDFIAAAQAPEFEYCSAITGSRYFGRDAMRKLMEEVDEVIADYRLELERLIEAGDQVIASIRLIGTGRGSGTPATQPAAMALTCREGKLVSGTGYATVGEALEAVGLAE